MFFKNKLNKIIFGAVFLAFFCYTNFTQALEIHSSLLPNDRFLNGQSYLEQIKAFAGWDIISESPEITVAIIDSGVDIEHPDLAQNIWVNKKEIPKDGIDNDNNGYIDDTNGWDFVLNIPDPKPKFAGEFSRLGMNHGTVVSGIIGALGNNYEGVAGITWSLKIMPLKVMDAQGFGSTEMVAKAIDYAVANGADIINLSMVGDGLDERVAYSIAQAYEKGLIIVAAAGNEKMDASGHDLSINLDNDPRYPICHDGPEGANYVLGVGSVDANDKKSIFSNFGSSCIDLVAPGEGFFGTTFFAPVLEDYRSYYGGYWSGTSLSTPLVSGTAALVKSLRPDLSNTEIYNLIINNTDSIESKNYNHQGRLGNGRLNVSKVLTAAGGIESTALNLIITATASHSPVIKTINAAGKKRSEFLAYAENFTGGINTTGADFDHDGVAEIVTAAGKTGGPHIRVFKANGNLVSEFFAYESSFDGGVNIAAGNVDSDEDIEIITVPESGRLAEVKVFNLKGELKKSFLAFGLDKKNGANLALSDINGDGIKEILIASAAGQSPEVKVFNTEGKLLLSFLAYDKNYQGGVKVAASNLFSDNRTEIITIPAGQGIVSEVKVFTHAGGEEISFKPWGDDYNGGSNLASGNADTDQANEIVVSKAGGYEPQVAILNYKGGVKAHFSVFEDDFRGGVNVSLK